MIKFVVNFMLDSWPDAVIESVGDGRKISREMAYESDEFFVFKNSESRTRWHDSDTSVEPMIHVAVSDEEIVIASELESGEAALIAEEVNEKINMMQNCIGDA